MYQSTASILDDIAAAIEIRDKRLSIRPTAPECPPLELPLPLESARAQRAIAAYLYAHYYAYDPSLYYADALDYLTLLGQRVSDHAFLASLAAANPGSGYFAAGWRVVAYEPHGNLRVENDGLTLEIDPTRHLRPEHCGAKLGDSVDVRFPRDSAMGAPGFYVAFGDAGPAVAASLSRVYLNVDARFAVELTRQTLQRLQRLGIPYTYKVVADPERYTRRDTVVLYVSREEAQAAILQVLLVHDEFPQGFRAPVPSFTFMLRNGIAVADDPGGSSATAVSFGEHRTGLIAEAVCHFVKDTVSFQSDALRLTIERHLRSAGLDIGRMHLAAGGEDYVLQPTSGRI